MKPDFSGWATKYGIKCKDNRTIMPGAFQHNDQKTIPLVYMHSHNDINNVLGHAILTHKPEGVWADCYVNGTEGGRKAKEAVQHGDLTAFSIFADELVESFSGAVSHGDIKELSLVLVGANSGATIENVIAHDSLTGESYTDESAAIFKMEAGSIVLEHADKTLAKDSEDSLSHADEPKDEETIEDVLKSMTEKQRNVLMGLVGVALESATKASAKHDGFQDIEGGNDMYNIFEGDGTAPDGTATLQHSDIKAIFDDAKRYGSLKESFVQHGFPSPKFIQHSIDDIDYLYPDATLVDKTPGWIKRPTEWVDVVMKGVKHKPFSRIKSMFADITEDDARAKGYIKGKQKKEEVFGLLKRTTGPTTVYKKQAIDRDDWIDIVDFDVVIWLKSEMRMMLDEELARAFLIGDGRSASSDDKIDEQCIRPIAFDDDFYSLKRTINVGSTATESERAMAFIKSVIRSRKDYRGSGNPALFLTDDLLCDLLLLTDANGRFIYESMDKLKGVLRVSAIHTVPVMDGLKNKDGKPIVAIMVNLSDYAVGADKGGAVALFDDFDIDYNKQKYLIETRCSGALVVPASAIVFTINTNTVVEEPEDEEDEGQEPAQG